MQRKLITVWLTVVIVGASPSVFAEARYLSADGKTDSYALINRTLGVKAVEPPDCSHPEFGPHIRQEFDNDLGKPVFVFYLHAAHDNDRCINFDRQRNEIKTYDKSPAYLKGYRGDAVAYRWRFKLDNGFQASRRFTHLHQLKAVDGDDRKPVVTLTARGGNQEQLELIHVDSATNRRVLEAVALAPFKGAWVEAYERVTYGARGSYAVTLTRVRDGAVLLAHHSEVIDLWRNGTSFVRPKWGIYRSLEQRHLLRDEAVRFDGFCLTKGGDDCAATATTVSP